MAPGHGGGVFGGANADTGAGPGNLPEGDLDLGIVFAQPAASHIVINTDDLPVDGRPEPGDSGDQLFNGDPLLEGVLILEEFVDEALIDDGHFHAGGIVLIGEGASADETDAEGLEIVRSDHSEARQGALRGVSVGGSAGDGEWHAEARAFERQSGFGRGMRDSGNGGDAVEDLAVVGGDERGVFGTRVGHVEEEGEDVVGLDAEVDAHEVPEAVDGEAGSGEQRQREGEFADYEGPAQAVAARAHARAAAFLEGLGGIDARGVPGGCAAEEESGERGCREREEQDRHVKAEVGLAGQDVGRHGGDESTQHGIANTDTRERLRRWRGAGSR